LSKPVAHEELQQASSKALESRSFTEWLPATRPVLPQSNFFVAREPVDERNPEYRRPNRLVRSAGIDTGRDGQRKRSACARIARQLPASEQAILEAQLRRIAFGTGRKRAIRVRARRIYRGLPEESRNVRSGERGHHLSRRNRGYGRAAPGQAPARTAGSRVSTHRGKRSGEGRRPGYGRDALRFGTSHCRPDVSRILFYRLNVINLQFPPLRERKEDIVRLAEHLLARHIPVGAAAPRITVELKQAMLRYHCSGNVRELENVMRRLLVLHNPDVIPRELDAKSNRKSLVAAAIPINS